MKIVVISDSHGNIANVKHVMGFAKKINAGAVIHAGDWDNIETIEALLTFEIPLFTVMGNADVEEGIEEYLKFNSKKFDPNFLKFEINGRKIGVIHKAKSDDKRFTGLDIVFSGHYHSSEMKMVDFTKFVRPGALINDVNFVIYETENNEAELINEQI